MRISPKQLLQGLIYTTPVLLLALASCGGGGGGTSSPLGAAYILSVNVTGISGVVGTSGVVLRNGGDNMTVTTPGTYAFANQVLSGTTYNISVLSQPTPPQRCTVTGPTAVMPASAKTVAVNCVPAYTIGGTAAGTGGVSGLGVNTSVVLQDNGSDNKMISANGDFSFDTPVASGVPYTVSVLANPAGQTCSVTNPSGIAITNVTNVKIACTNLPPASQPDQHVYVANFGSNDASAYPASGVLSAGTSYPAGSGPTAIAVYGGTYAFVTNGSANTVSAYKLSSGALGAIVANTATGNSPAAIAVHPSGKFVYVVNKLSNSISAYSVNTSTGALASIDADGATTAYDASIATRSTPVSIALDPSGSHAYVANAGTGDVSVYSIDSLTGSLTAIPATGVSGQPTYISTQGTTPNSVAVDPADHYLYVTNRGTSNSISIFPISTSGALSTAVTKTAHGTTDYPVSIAIDPTGVNVYVVNNGTTLGSVSLYTANGTGGLNYVNNVPAGTAPISIAMDSTGQYAYVANSGSNDISVYSVAGGTLTRLQCNCAGPNFPAGTQPYGITTAP